ncbi:hypothetical protein [Mesorhizobium sophorae]|uniref:hypothetical protein n=1 Tax=Mesorhizobium sophorae TaxID=1300294 RepID=UPI00142DCDEB|nr:hypothetical protein [Mesorhizobium sophorae]
MPSSTSDSSKTSGDWPISVAATASPWRSRSTFQATTVSVSPALSRVALPPISI